eukprot:7859970-Ditylum_brightwellii.AAC.1
MRCKEFPEDDCCTASNIKMETLKILGEWGITDQPFKNCECIFTTDNWLGNTAGGEGIKTIVSRITCADHRISTILMDMLNKKQQSIDG